MELIEKVLTLYWSQATLILLAIGYLIKRVLDNKSKKIEINYTIFQQKRLETLQKFISAYSDAELMWREINLDEVATKTVTAETINAIIEPVIKKIRSTVLELQIYMDKKDFALFEEILNNTNSYYYAIKGLHLNYSDETAFQKLKGFKGESEHYLIKNKELISRINEIAKKTFS